MDVERTIEFLFSNQAKHEERLTRLETVAGSLGGSVDSLAARVDSLVGSVNSLIGSVGKSDKVERLDGAMVMLAESGVQTNRRIDTLVSAMGAIIQPPPQ